MLRRLHRSPSINAPDPRLANPHSLAEDVYTFAIGCSFVVLGLVWLNSAGLVTGDTAGVALLLFYLVPLPAGLLLNLPFFWLARRSMGSASWPAPSTGLALLAPLAFRLEDLNGLFAALFGGTIIGMGILSLARHHDGVEGLGIVALTLQRRRGWKAGRTSLLGDALILLTSLPVLAPKQFLLSVASRRDQRRDDRLPQARPLHRLLGTIPPRYGEELRRLMPPSAGAGGRAVRRSGRR